MPERRFNAGAVVNETGMPLVQIGTLLSCFLITILVGMDVLVISFAAPSISESWQIRPESLGLVFSAALSGMMGGALGLAPLADRIGRKRLILGCTVLMGASVLATAWAQSLGTLVILRFLSGLGTGGLLATATTLSSEFAPDKSKSFWISLVLAGYPAGAVLAGLSATALIDTAGWRSLFQFAGGVTLLAIPATAFFMAESLQYLLHRQPKHALQKVNILLQRFKIPPLASLPTLQEKPAAASIRRLLQGPLRMQTLILWLCFFMAFTSLYFLLSWIPKLTTEAGMPATLGIYSGTVLNAGAFCGILTAGGLALKFGLQRTICLFFASAALLMILFDFVSGSALVLVVFGLIGFALQGGLVGLYAVAARRYPALVRSTGVGWSIGIGRIGAILGPLAAGFLVAAGASLAISFASFAMPCVVGSISVLFIRLPQAS